MIAFVYRKDLIPGAKAKVYMASSLAMADKVEGLPRYSYHGVDATFRPTESRCILLCDPDLCTPGVLAQMGLKVAEKFPGATLKIDASWERKCWDVWVEIPSKSEVTP